MKRRMFIRAMVGGAGFLGGLAGCHSGVTNAPQSTALLDPYRARRMKMIDEQLKGPGRGITHPQVLKAMELVPRHAFVPPSQKEKAYEDRPLPIGHGQTISQPYVVAFMTVALDPQPGDRILEVGTGSGYQAAVLSKLVREVYSIEIVEPLAQKAHAVLEELGYDNVHVRFGDGYEGWEEEAPFDGVIVTCAPNHVPQPLIDQMKEGGKMIIPVGTRFNQELILLEKVDGALQRRSVLPVRFVPMTGEAEAR